MAYVDARRALLAHGWEPVPDPECKSNVCGGDQTAYAQHPEKCKICDEMPELSAYSGQGDCLMNFKRGTQTMQIGAYGDIFQWKTNGRDTALFLTFWGHWPPSSR